MSSQKIKSTPDLTINSDKHQEAIAKGTEHFFSSSRNVADHFKDKSEEDIRATLKATASPFAILLENWLGDFNVSCSIRSANGFNAKEIFYLGNKKIDRRGMVGVQNYSDIKWLSSIEEFIKLKEKYVIIGIDNINGSVPISTYKFVSNTLFVFGEEGVGLTPMIQSYCDAIVEIPMRGSVRSFNCAVSSGIIMWEFVRQMTENKII